MNALILAGAPNAGPLQEAASVDYEALIPIQGRPMYEYVLEALLAVPQIQQIGIVGPASLTPPKSTRVVRVEMGTSLIDNLTRGMGAFQEDRPVLVVTSDIPLISPQAIVDFLDSCEPQSEVCYPLIPKGVMEEVFPGGRRTYFRLREGVFTGGNMMLMQPGVVGACEELMNKVVSLRKRPWQLSRLLGLGFLFKFIIGRLSISDILAQGKRIAGIKGQVVICPYAEVGFDVDKPEHFQAVERVLATNGSLKEG